MEKKYIIKLEENEIAYKTVNSNGRPMIGLLHTAPYIEPDLEQVRKDYDAFYEQGLADAWDAARKICLNECDGGMTPTEVNKIFGVGFYRDALLEYSASEAIEKIRQYEQEKEEQIQVGDEVKGKYGTTAGMLGIVTRLDDALQNYNVVWSDGSTICFTGYRERGDVVKTGRHFPEIAEVLQKMKEAE